LRIFKHIKIYFKHLELLLEESEVNLNMYLVM